MDAYSFTDLILEMECNAKELTMEALEAQFNESLKLYVNKFCKRGFQSKQRKYFEVPKNINSLDILAFIWAVTVKGTRPFQF